MQTATLPNETTNIAPPKTMKKRQMKFFVMIYDEDKSEILAHAFETKADINRFLTANPFCSVAEGTPVIRGYALSTTTRTQVVF